MLEGLPEPEFFLPAWWKRWRFDRRLYDNAFHAPSVLHLAHAKCLDGAACDVLHHIRYGPGAVRTVFLEPHETATALTKLRNVPGRARILSISDLSLQRGEEDAVGHALEALRANGWKIQWRDHHHKQWDKAPIDQWREHATLEVDFSGAECGATLVQKTLLPADAFAEKLATTVRDHDLWLLKIPQSLVLQNAIMAAGNARFIRHLLAARSVDTPQISAWAAREARRKRALVEKAVRGARITRAGEAVVALAYGRVPTNDVLHALMERGAHLGILIKPDGAFSLRSRKGVDVCHEIAQQLNGGGHPNASGGRLPIRGLGHVSLWTNPFGHPRVRALRDAAISRVQGVTHPRGTGTRSR